MFSISIFIVYSIIAFNYNVNNLEQEITYLNNKIQDLDLDLYNIEQKMNQNAFNNTNETTNEFKETIFENTSTEGITPITETEAQNIWNQYRKLLINSSDDYNLEKIEIENIIPNNHLSFNYINGLETEKTANFYRKAYVLYCNMDDNLEHITAYIDYYTGDIIGGIYSGV